MAVLPTSASQQTRLDDYLNDKLQTFADFDTLDALLHNVRNQQGLLRKQLEEAEIDLKIAEERYAGKCAQVRQKARAFERHQADIDKRLLIVTQSDTSDEAVRRFDSVMEQLRRLDLADGYLLMLEEVERLRGKAISTLKDDPDAALDAYANLKRLDSSLLPLQEEAEGAAPHLIDHLGSVTRDVRETIKDTLSKDLQAVLTKVLWPKPNIGIPSSVQKEFDDSFGKLLSLHLPELEASNVPKMLSAAVKSQSTPALLPLQVMVLPFEERFRFHFSGKKPTNRLDKPEYFLSHFMDLVNTYSPFVNTYVQPILLKHFWGTSLMSEANCIDATSAFITALLPMLQTKLFAILPKVAGDPRMLSHLMHELMGFDSTLRKDWRYGVGNTNGDKSPWKGLSWEVLSQKEWFGRWLQVEKEFALARYQTIVDDPDSGTLDYDSFDNSTTKPSKAAIRVNDLLETITERYRPLVSFSQKLSFLMEIQISIFDQFHGRLELALEAFLAKTSSVGRTVQGFSAEDVANVKGVHGLDHLCRVFGSADYLERAMRDRSDDVFFLDLWNELQTRAKFRSPTANEATSSNGRSSFVSRHLSISDVAAKTSSTLEADDIDSIGAATGALFDETASAYARLRARAESVLLETIISALRDSLRPYARSNPWSSLSPPAPASFDADTISISLDLNAVLEILNTYLIFLSKALGTLPLRRIGRQVATGLDAYIFDRVLMGNSFSFHGARQVSADVDVLASTVNRHVGGQIGSRAMRRSLEACKVLALPVKGSEAEGLGLWDVERRLLGAEEDGREVLEVMRLEVLSKREVRELLRRRVEIAS